MRYFPLSVAVLTVLAACGDREIMLEGERLDIAGVEIAEDIVNRAQPLPLPEATANANWTHINGNVRHQLTHPALSRSLQRAWSVSIGQGNDRKHRITADPVVADGRVHTLDSRALVSAITTSGTLIWTHDLTPAADSLDDASGGGIAVGGGAVFATSGFGTLSAMNAASGEVLWTQDLEASATGAPTVADGVVYVVSRNSVGWAIDAGNGRILWQILGAISDSGITGGPAPAISDSLVIFPFSSGQMVAVARGTGAQVWSSSVSGKRLGRAFSRFSDLSSDPVVSGNLVYAGNHSGRAAAFDTITGRQVWRANEGALSPLWIAGGSAFLVSDENRLIRLDATSGDAIWAVDLPFFETRRIKRRKSITGHFGPVLAGGRLVLLSDDGMMREIDPVTGSIIASTPLPGNAARNPVVAGGALYVVTDKGELHAFR